MNERVKALKESSFRDRSGKLHKPPVSVREWFVVGFGLVSLTLTTWLFGGVETWSLHPMLLVSVLTLVAAVIPMPKSWNGVDGLHGNYGNWKRLLKFPVFWCGLLFLIYVAIQGFNPSWVRLEGRTGWWVQRLDAEAYVPWLPSGVDTAYEPMNAFRVLSSFAAMFLLVWALWVGVRRRQAALVLLWGLAINGTLMAFVAILQDLTSAREVLWLVKPATPNLWGSFFYRNQGAAYLVQIMSVAAALFFYYFSKGRQRGDSAGAHWMLFLMVALCFVSICLCASRGGFIFGAGFYGFFIFLAVIYWLKSIDWGQGRKLLSIATLSLMSVVAWGLFSQINVDRLKWNFRDFGQILVNIQKNDRYIISELTWEMAQKRPIFGWGAGSWRYIYPMYQKKRPEVYYKFYDRYYHSGKLFAKDWHAKRRISWYAHNDLFQFLAEFGIVGCSFLVLTFAYWIWHLLMRSSGNALSALMILVGMSAAFGHALVDLIFQSPAYWIAFNVLICLTVKLLSLEHERRRL